MDVVLEPLEAAELEADVYPVLQMKGLSQKEVTYLAQGHPVIRSRSLTPTGCSPLPGAPTADIPKAG